MLYEKLFDWQKNIIDLYINKEAWGLYLDMGLGKTIVSLAFAEIHNCEKIIIISLNSKCEESADLEGSWKYWASQMEKNYNCYDKHYKNKFNNDSEDLLLINYESTYKVINKELKNKKQHIIHPTLNNFINSCKNKKVSLIIDESHNIKNKKAVQTKIITKVQKILKLKSSKLYTYLLSGTPFTKNYIDTLKQLNLLGCNMTKGEFVRRFCEVDNKPGLLGWQQPITGYKNLNDFYDLLHKYAVTILSKDVISLPEQVYVYYNIPSSNSFKFLVNEKLKWPFIKKELVEKNINYKNDEFLNKHGENDNKLVNNPFYRNLSFPDFTWLADTPGTFWLRARQINIGFQGNSDNYKWFDYTRLNVLKRFIEQMDDNLVCFYNYDAELYTLYTLFEEAGYKIDVYCGDVKSTYFYDEYCKFTTSQKITQKKRVILSNFGSGAAGKNWQQYNKCIIFSIPLYGDWAQALKRTHRIGSKNTVIYYIFSSNNWLDKKMKQTLFENIEYNEQMFYENLITLNDIENEV
jgi:hypothetical protein